MQPHILLAGWRFTRTLKRLIAGLSAVAFLAFVAGGPSFTSAQEKKPAATATNSAGNAASARGRRGDVSAPGHLRPRHADARPRRPPA